MLAHELVHDERGGGCVEAGMPPSWADVVTRDELIVRREVADWLVPRHDLVVFIDRRVVDSAPGVTAWEVSEEFDVPEEVAMLALRLLAQTPSGWAEVTT